MSAMEVESAVGVPTPTAAFVGSKLKQPVAVEEDLYATFKARKSEVEFLQTQASPPPPPHPRVPNLSRDPSSPILW